jgi:hypothetical protein
MTYIPEQIWAWHWHSEWNENPPASGPKAIAQSGHCRPNNRYPLDKRERDSGAEYTRTDLIAAMIEEAVQAEREACAKLRYFHPEGETMAQMRDHARSHPLYREGDLKLVWVNEGDLCNLAIRAAFKGGEA